MPTGARLLVVSDALLRVQTLPSPEQGLLVLQVVGEIDLYTVGRLREHLHQVPGAHRAVVLDCTGVSFLSACGIALLIETVERARTEGAMLWLVADGRPVLRALEAAGVNGLISRVTTVADAVAQYSS